MLSPAPQAPAARGERLHEPAAEGHASRLSLAADSPSGPVQLLLPPELHSPAQAALLLHRAATWLDALEDWLAPGELLHWAPAAAAGPGTAPGRLRAAIAWGHRTDEFGGPQGLELEAAPLFQRPAPPPLLGLQWPALAAELLLGRQDLPPEDLAGLALGSVLLIEASFCSDWQAWLRLPAGCTAMAPTWGRSLCAGSEASWFDRPSGLAARAPGSGVLEFRQALAEPLPAERLFGWAPLATALEPATPISLWWVDRSGQQPDCELARGERLAWGRGQALRVTELCAPERCAQLQAERAWT
ncbi:MAG: hypothetical protein CFE41_07655 [Burkholderiales bacterium PBB2]|nr:MAG: hypothetical protein CFE41_07655 [Burkholderiales bacterium PBB2]